MQSKAYTIEYKENEESKKFDCSSYSLQKFIGKFEEEGKEIISVTKYPIKKKPKDNNKKEKQRYYNSKYSTLYKQRVKGKISNEEFDEIITKLKELKAECITLPELVTKFELYIKKH